MKTKPIIAIGAPVTVIAGVIDGDKKSPATFEVSFYTGGALEINGWDLPVVVDLAGLDSRKVLVANLDHDRTKRVGNFEVANDGKSLTAFGTASAATAARDEVVKSAADGYQWQASLEVDPRKVEEVKAGKSVQVNGQDFVGPIYVTRKGTLQGFGFVSHGADDSTHTKVHLPIAAIAAVHKEQNAMDPKLKVWIEAMGFDPETLTPEQLAGLKENYEGTQIKPEPKKVDAGNPFAEQKAELQRRKEIRQIAEKFVEMRPNDVEEIEKLHDHAIEAKMAPQEFRCEMYEASAPAAYPAIDARTNSVGKLLPKVLEAAVCAAGRLEGDWEKQYGDQVCQLAHDKYRNIGLKQLFFIAAAVNGYRDDAFGTVTLDVQRAAFGMLNNRRAIHADGFSTVSLSNVLSNLANKFLHEGWMAVDMTPMSIAAIRPVNDFKQITTVSLTGDLQYEKVGQAGEIKHGTVSDLVYNNQADTYARLLAITRKDIINDDLGALTSVPRRLGRGGALKLNDVFWTVFLNNSSFFTSGNTNVNTAVADSSNGGIAATETIFLNQTDPDGKPLGITPKILLVPTASKWAFDALVDPSGLMITGASSTIPNVNVFRGKFQVFSSPYMSNSAYTGYDAAAWYMLASPAEMPVAEIAALNGRVEPIVESAEAEFHTLGVQMRGYSDIGVSLQEYRGGVRADGGAS